MHQIQIASSKFTLPEKQEELDSQQLKTYVESVYSLETKIQKQYDFLMASIKASHQRLINKLTKVQLAQLLDCVSWINEELSPEPILKEFTYKKVSYYSPLERMRSSALAEFVFADAYLQKIAEGEEYLNLVLACLYRPKEKKSRKKDKREKFDTDSLELRAEELKGVDTAVKLSCLYFFIAVKKYIHSRYGILFEKIESEEETEEGGNEFSWSETMMGIAESGVFGDLEKVKYSNLHEILMYLSKKEKERRRLERQKREGK